MKFAKLWLKAYGPFDDRMLDFERSPAGLHIVYGPNEAGKSSALRAMTALLFGVPSQTADSFVHDYPALRVGAVVVTDEPGRLAVMRRKGNRATLFEFDEASGRELTERPLPPETFSRMLGEVDQPTFLNMFGIDHLRLRAGGRELLEGRGEIGQSLFQAASGLAGIRKVLAELDARAASLFKPGGSVPAVNAGIREFAEAKRRVRDALVRPKVWKERQERLREAESGAQELLQRIQRLHAEERQLLRLRATIPALMQREQWLIELNALCDVPLLSEDAPQQRVAAEKTLENEQKTLNEAKALLTEYQAELAGLNPPEAVLAVASEIEALRLDAARAANALTNLQRSRTLLSSREAAIADWIARLAPEVSVGDVRRLVPDRTAIARVRDLAGRMTEGLAGAEGLREQAADLQRELKGAAGELAGLPEVPDLSVLQTTIETLSRQGDLEAQAENAALDTAQLAGRLGDEIRSLGLTDAEALRVLPVPLDDEIEGWRSRFQGHREAVSALEREEEDLRKDLEQVDAELSGLEAAGEVVTADKVEVARGHRDRGWSLVRQAYVERSGDADALSRSYRPESTLAEAYEAAVRHADALADELRADTERAAHYGALAKRLEQMRSKLSEIDSRRHRLDAAERAGREEWHSVTARLGLPAMEPQVLQQWCANRRIVLNLLQQHDQRVMERDSLRIRVQNAREALVSALRQASLPRPDAAATLAVALELAARTVRDTRQRRERREHAEREVARLVRDLERCRSRLQTAEAQHSGLRRQWETALAPLHLPAEAAPAEAEVRIDDLDRLRDAATEAERHREEIMVEQNFLNEHLDRAVRLASRLGIGAPVIDQVAAMAERLAAELAEARTIVQRKSALDASVRRERERMARALSAGESASADLERLCAAAGCAEPAGLPEAESRSHRRRQAEDQLMNLERQLISQWQSSPETLLAEAEGWSIETAEERLSEVQRQLTDVEASSVEAQRAVADARRDFLAIDGAAAAAEAQEEAESLLARMRHDAEHYARLRLARTLLEQGIRSFQEKAQGPLLVRASHYFELLTGGRYVRLRADYENDLQVLVAENGLGRDLHVGGMSEGTADQLYLAMRLAAIDLHLESSRPMPVVLDDVLLTFDDERSGHALRALADLSAKTQVLLFTHHRHVLELAAQALPRDAYGIAELSPSLTAPTATRVLFSGADSIGH